MADIKTNPATKVAVEKERDYRFGFLKAHMPIEAILSSKDAYRTVRRELTMSLSEELYHYTTLAGFRGIVESGGFWASDNRFLNDEFELKEGALLVERVLRERVRREPAPYFGIILAEVAALIAAPLRTGHLVACFSSSRDSLEQWRAYGADGGVCIRLGRAKEGERALVIGPEQLPYRAFYCFREKVRLILSIIRRYEREYHADRVSWGAKWPDDHKDEYVKYLYSSLSASTVAFKNEAFSHEAEIRLVVPPSGYKKGLQFRISSFGLIPYVCTSDHRAVGNNGPLPIREIIVGPHPRKSLLADSLRTFLDYNGYSATEVSLSKVPFRR